MKALHSRRRIVWLILDGLGFRHWERVRGADPSALPAMTRFTEEGFLVSTEPSAPVCQTPAALFTLFSGLSPLRHGILGYRMPAFDGPAHRCVSGFSARPLEGRPIWEDLEDRGLSYSLMNVAFRNDPLWTVARPGLAIAFDGYRTLRGTREYRLRRGWRSIRFRGIDLHVCVGTEGVEIRKGGRKIVRAPMGRMTEIRLTRGTRGIAFPADDGTLFLFSANRAVTRGACAEALATREFLDAQVFKAMRSRFGKGKGGAVPDARPSAVSVEHEMAPATASFAVQRRIALEMVDHRRTDLTVLYFPLIDYVNHAYMDAIDSDWPEGHGSGVLRSSFGLLDGLIGDLSSRCGPDDLLVISSDHGAVPFRRTFHVNELFAEAGLLPRKEGRFQFSNAPAYYHPCDCGLVLFLDHAARRMGMERSDVLLKVREIARRAQSRYGVPLGIEDVRPESSLLSILYPLDDTRLSSAPCGPGHSPLRTGKAGGHHESPLCPSPWIASILGLWGPDRKRLPSRERIPSRNEDVKEFLLEMLGCLTTSDTAVESTGRP